MQEVVPGLLQEPTTQHTAAPALLKVPAPHAPHVAPEVAPTAGLNVPAAQLTHVDEPGAAPKVPIAQGRHAVMEALPLFGPNLPVGQGVAFSECRGQYEPMGQVTGAPEEQ